MDIQKVILLLQSTAKLTQSKISSAIGCSQSSVSCYARGKHGVVRPTSKIVDGLRKLLSENGLTAEISTVEKQGQKEPQ